MGLNWFKIKSKWALIKLAAIDVAMIFAAGWGYTLSRLKMLTTVLVDSIRLYTHYTKYPLSPLS